MTPEWLSWLDVGFLFVVLMLALGGFQRGFTVQLAHVLTFIASGVLLFFTYPFILRYFSRVFQDFEENHLIWMTLITLLILGIALFVLISKLIAGLLRMQIGDKADHRMGFLLGAVFGVLTVLSGLVILVMVNRESSEQLCEKSHVGKFVCNEIIPVVELPLTEFYENRIKGWKAELMHREESDGVDTM